MKKEQKRGARGQSMVKTKDNDDVSFLLEERQWVILGGKQLLVQSGVKNTYTEKLKVIWKVKSKVNVKTQWLKRFY